MSTATAISEADQAQQDHLPVALWMAYRRQRARREKPQYAASIALDGAGYTSQRNRERLSALLQQREKERGLASSEAEQDQERELELAEIEAGGAVAPVEPEPGSTAAVRADAERRVIELEEQRRRMSVEALTDPKVKQELLDVESEIALARSTLDLADTAETEIQRREREASEAAARAVREQGEAEARELQPQIHLAAVELDAAAHAFAERAAAYRDLKEGAAALNVAMSEHGIGGAIEGFEGNRRDTSMAACEAEEWS